MARPTKSADGPRKRAVVMLSPETLAVLGDSAVSDRLNELAVVGAVVLDIGARILERDWEAGEIAVIRAAIRTLAIPASSPRDRVHIAESLAEAIEDGDWAAPEGFSQRLRRMPLAAALAL